MIALSMIVAGHENPEDLKRCLVSASPHVDGIFITITTPTKGKKLEEMCKEFGAVVDYWPNKFFHKVNKKQVDWLREFLGTEPKSKVGQKIFLFDKARNHALDQIPEEYEWILWLDVDDILRGGDKLKDVVKVCEENQVDSAFFNYLYQVEIEEGEIKNILIEHLRERLVKRGVYKWKAPIHETLIEERPTKKVDFTEVDVVHLSTDKRRVGALERNLAALEFSIYQTKGKDPRPTYYLGKAYFDVWLGKEKPEVIDLAKTLFEKYVAGDDMSGWPAERAQCWGCQSCSQCHDRR
jgi:hypothetical protein